MGLLLQIIGVLTALVSLVFSIIAIVNGTSSTVPVILVFVGATLVRIGRVIYNKTKK